MNVYYILETLRRPRAGKPKLHVKSMNRQIMSPILTETGGQSISWLKIHICLIKYVYTVTKILIECKEYS